ncbi:MAG: HTTM domain-containing protein [Verrucomicrobiales bacterium]|nr:HTTM domain-containing protein [Verrucomicrobiales bacterium]
MSQPSAKQPSVYHPFATFSFVWAVTTLVHQLAFTFWTESWQGWVLVATAIATIFRPACTLRFTFLVGASLVNLWHKLPFVPNHILFEGMLHLIMLLGALSFFWKGQGRGAMQGKGVSWRRQLPFLIGAVAFKVAYFQLPEPWQGHGLGALTTLLLLFGIGRFLSKGEVIGKGDDFLARFAPVIRVAVVIMYLWAVVQKLNWDYFNADVSCAGKLHREINAYFGSILPEAPWALVAAAVGSLVFELGIPLLLSFKKTRYAGFVAAIGFHLWLSIHPAAGIFSFSSLILAFLVFFLPFSWGEQLQLLWNRHLTWFGKGDEAKGRQRARWMVVLLFFVTLIAQGMLYLTIARSYEVFDQANRVGFYAFFGWGCWLGASYLIAGWKAGRKSEALPNRLAFSFVLIGLAPVLLNGLQPWIGGRTQTSFSMYSNLRSEGTSNHMFLKRIDLLKLQTDMVEVLQSSPNILGPSERPRGIQQFANIGHRILPWFEFRRLVSEMPGDFEVTYLRDGKELELGRREGEIYGDDSAFVEIPLLKRKFLWFRRLEALDGPMTCTH